MTSTTATSQQFCVRWNSHLGSLGAAFPQLLAGQRFVDVTLACEGHQVHCHRLVLAACSTYFESLLGENPCKHPIIILPRDIRLWEIQALVDFMYKGEVNVSQAGLADLLKCAETLQIRGLCGTDAALNLNQLTQMGIGATKVPTTSNGSTVAVKSSNGLIATTEKTQPSMLSTALTTTSGKPVQSSTNKSITSTAAKSTNNDTSSRLPVISTQTTTVPNKTPDTTRQRRSERKSNQQQMFDEQDELVLDDDIEIKCEDLIIGEYC
jgi:BTB/POZ domain